MIPEDIDQQLDACVARAEQWRNHEGKPVLTVMPKAKPGVADVLVVDGKHMRRRYAYLEVPSDARAICYAAMHLLGVVASHGPGRVWFALRPVHLVSDDGVREHPGFDDLPCCRVRTVYYHEATAERGEKA